MKRRIKVRAAGWQEAVIELDLDVEGTIDTSAARAEIIQKFLGGQFRQVKGPTFQPDSSLSFSLDEDRPPPPPMKGKTWDLP